MSRKKTQEATDGKRDREGQPDALAGQESALEANPNRRIAAHDIARAMLRPERTLTERVEALEREQANQAREQANQARELARLAGRVAKLEPKAK